MVNKGRPGTKTVAAEPVDPELQCHVGPEERAERDPEDEPGTAPQERRSLSISLVGCARERDGYRDGTDERSREAVHLPKALPAGLAGADGGRPECLELSRDPAATPKGQTTAPLRNA